LKEKRSYKPAMPVKQVMEIINEMAGTKLDAESVQALREVVEGGELAL
jgi:HD-GYP domain-containing protein (c-di-GMP phosphodiesterase class II)